MAIQGKLVSTERALAELKAAAAPNVQCFEVPRYVEIPKIIEIPVRILGEIPSGESPPTVPVVPVERSHNSELAKPTWTSAANNYGQSAKT